MNIYFLRKIFKNVQLPQRIVFAGDIEKSTNGRMISNAIAL